jgi:hypothetical protein
MTHTKPRSLISAPGSVPRNEMKNETHFGGLGVEERVAGRVAVAVAEDVGVAVEEEELFLVAVAVEDAELVDVDVDVAVAVAVEENELVDVDVAVAVEEDELVEDAVLVDVDVAVADAVDGEELVEDAVLVDEEVLLLEPLDVSEGWPVPEADVEVVAVGVGELEGATAEKSCQTSPAERLGCRRRHHQLRHSRHR